MNQILKCVLLIDDDAATNFFNETIISRAGFAELVRSFLSAEEALDYLKESHQGQGHFPELIFLDINMPGMNGWEFLEAFRAAGFLPERKVVIIMLTTSINPDDQVRAAFIKEVQEFVHKPLTLEKLNHSISTYFPG